MFGTIKNHTFKRPPIGCLLMALTHPLVDEETELHNLLNNFIKVASLSVSKLQFVKLYIVPKSYL